MKTLRNIPLLPLACFIILSCGCSKSSSNPAPPLPASPEQQKQDDSQAQKTLTALQAVPADQRHAYVHDHFVEIGSVMRSQDPKVQGQFKQIMADAK